MNWKWGVPLIFHQLLLTESRRRQDLGHDSFWRFPTPSTQSQTGNPNCEGYSAESSFNEYMSIGGGVVVVDVVVDWWSAHLIYLRVPTPIHPHPYPNLRFSVFNSFAQSLYLLRLGERR